MNMVSILRNFFLWALHRYYSSGANTKPTMNSQRQLGATVLRFGLASSVYCATHPLKEHHRGKLLKSLSP
jgi:hypothetical protein